MEIMNQNEFLWIAQLVQVPWDYVRTKCQKINTALVRACKHMLLQVDVEANCFRSSCLTEVERHTVEQVSGCVLLC